MPRVHLLNVSPGDCTIIEHGSGRVTVMDICSGNQKLPEAKRKQLVAEHAAARPVKPGGNFGMCEQSTDPVEYLRSIGVRRIFRFILSHPDMDHMDGLDRLFGTFPIRNFWETGSRRPKPKFDGGRFLEADWDRFEAVRAGLQKDCTAAVRRSGERFAFANQNEEGEGGGDGLRILAPSKELVADPDYADDVNEGSFVVAYRSSAGTVLLPGDAHDAAWEHIAVTGKKLTQPCAFMLAPHHGRGSGRTYDFLDMIRPKLTLMGCAPCEYHDLDQWRRRELDYITSNQAGNVVLEISSKSMDVFIENEAYVAACKLPTERKNDQGYTFYKRLIS